MRRREVLAAAAALVPGGLAGCLTGPGGEVTTTATTTGDTTKAATTTAGTTTTGDGTTSAGTTADDTTAGGTTSAGTTADGTTTDGMTGETTTGGGPTLVEQSFEATGGGCGKGTDAATASFGSGRVTVSGTISGRDACRKPRLAGARYDAAADELVVRVETYGEGGMCAECLVDLDYEATFRFDGGLPGTVVVHHASRGGTRTVLRASG